MKSPKHKKARVLVEPAKKAKGTDWEAFSKQLVSSCVEAEAFLILSKAFKKLPAQQVTTLIEDWDSTTLAAVCHKWKPQRLADLLSSKKASYVSECCESWGVKRIGKVLGLLPVKMASKVLKKLYFNTSDPYLSTMECQSILHKYPQQNRKKLLAKLDVGAVQAVMEATSDDEDEEDGSDDGSSYDDSFINDSDDLGEMSDAAESD